MIQRKEFARRRRQLMDMMTPNSIAIVPAARERIRNRDVEYPFRQDSDFYYLTGFPEPEAVVALIRTDRCPGRAYRGDASGACIMGRARKYHRPQDV